MIKTLKSVQARKTFESAYINQCIVIQLYDMKVYQNRQQIDQVKTVLCAITLLTLSPLQMT